jgi:hypothetical protein
MSLHSVGASPNYVLPASASDVPQAWKSNASAKPIECSLQTTNVPALSGNVGQSGTSNIQLPLGSGSGIMLNPYLRFDVSVAVSAAATVAFRGPNALASACLNTYTTFINSVQCDQIANASEVYEQLLSHGSSTGFMENDATILMSRGQTFAAEAAGNIAIGTQVIPLLGCLGSQQGFPAYLCSGTLQITLQWNSIIRAFRTTVENLALITGYTISNVQLVYDKISPEGSFVEAMKREMDMGQKYVLSYLNIENSAFSVAQQTASIQYGLNVSSLRAVVASQVLAANEILAASANPSQANTLSNFQVSLDGRLINNTNFTVANGGDSVIFAELNKCFSRLFDASVSDVAVTGTSATLSFLEAFFAVGVSACRVNESLAFSGSKATQVSIQYNRSGGAAATLYLSFLSDRQVLIGAAGDITLVR